MIYHYLQDLWQIMLELSPWLLGGMVIAGILHALLPEGFVRKHLGGKGFGAVFRACAVGIPMPLCSCGVIPTTIGLRKDGASKGASMGFLISTPQTGVDSMLVSATFLGWPFALFKVGAALVSGLTGGLLVSAAEKEDDQPPADTTSEKAKGCCCHKTLAQSAHECEHGQEPEHESQFTKTNKLSGVLKFAFNDLLRDIYRWLIVGILAAAAISTLTPEGFFSDKSWAQGIWGMLLMFVIAMPMYICATASVPLAASLIAGGMPPGAALVLLMAGPTTNLATIGAILKTFGRKATSIYLITVAVMSVGLGMLFNQLLAATTTEVIHHHHEASWLHIASAIVLIALLAFYTGRDIFSRLRSNGSSEKVSVPTQ